MSIDNFMESFSDFQQSNKIVEAEKQADDNQKIKDMMEKATESKKKAQEAKENYEKLTKEGAKSDAIEIALLQYKKYKAQAEMTAADAKLLKKGKAAEEKAEQQERTSGKKDDK